MPEGSSAPVAAEQRLHLFGPMRFETAGRTIPVPRGDAQRLLGHLALHAPSAQRREVVSETLWPGARSRSLSDTLYRLRRCLGNAAVVVDADTVALGPGIAVDVHDFDRAAAGVDVADLERAAELYGELLPGVYDEWVLGHRAARHAALVAALRRVVADREQAGDLDRAVAAARRLLAADPLDESAHQTYLRLLGRLGRYGEAAAHFEALTVLLADELGVAPMPSTAELAGRLADERAVHAGVPPAEAVPFVGRVAERATLVRAVEAAFERRGGIVGIEGVAGIGKTRLLREVVASASWRGAAVGYGDVPEIPAPSALAPLARAVGALLSVPVRAEIESRLDSLTLRALGPLHDDWHAAHGAAAREDATRIGPALRVVGETIARAGPTVVVLDDVHWATASTWDHLAAFADGFALAGGLLALGYRRPDIEATPGWGVLQAWERSSAATLLTLGPLHLADLAELTPDDTDPADLLAFTGGVPFNIVELLHHRPVGRGDVTALLARRLDAVAPEHRTALDAAAVLGERIPFRAWLHVLGRSPLELGAVSDRLAAEGWIRPTEDGHAFAHDLLRAAVYDRLTDAERRALHVRAAAALLAVDPSNARARAHHLDRAGRSLEAADAYCEAASAHRAEAAYRDAIEAWGRAIELLPRGRPRSRLAVTLDLAEAGDAIGGRPEQRNIVAEAVELARRLGDEQALLRALLLAGGTAVQRGDTDAGGRTIAEALALAERRGDRRRIADATYRQADLLIVTGRWPDGQRAFHAALEQVDAAGDPWLHGRVLRGLAIAAVRMGQPLEAIRWLETARAAYRDAGDSLNEMAITANLLAAYYEVGSWDRLVAAAQEVVTAATRLGDVVHAGLAHHHLGLAALALGDRDRARTLLTAAQADFDTAGRRRLVGIVVNALGLVADDENDIHEATARYTEAIDIAQQIDAATEEAYASHDLGALLLRTGQPERALPLLRVARDHWAATGNRLLQAKSEACLGLALLDTGSSPDEPAALADAGVALVRPGDLLVENPQSMLWSLAQLLSGVGRTDDAHEVLERARRELVRQAASIADPDQRRGFFERVPVNRAIVDATSGAAAPATTAVPLARADAPLGRTLRADELVDVSWTIDAPDDDAIADHAARRRHRLRRLLREAAAAGAAPTDDDLAAALRVSRRTVLRDLATIDPTTSGLTRRRARRAAAPT